MGWAARAKEQKGNPQPAKLPAGIWVNPYRTRKALFDKGKTRGLVTFAGLVYAVDRHGTMRRTPMTQEQLAEQTTPAASERADADRLETQAKEPPVHA